MCKSDMLRNLKPGGSGALPYLFNIRQYVSLFSYSFAEEAVSIFQENPQDSSAKYTDYSVAEYLQSTCCF